jgi:hypothetical protein
MLSSLAAGEKTALRKLLGKLRRPV